MEFDIITGDAAHMSQAFPTGTMPAHEARFCWCKPKFKFEVHNGMLLGMVVHR